MLEPAAAHLVVLLVAAVPLVTLAHLAATVHRTVLHLQLVQLAMAAVVTAAQELQVA